MGDCTDFDGPGNNNPIPTNDPVPGPTSDPISGDCTNLQWQQVPGIGSQISIAEDGTVWAIAQMTDLDNEDKIYRQSDDGQSWIEVNGRLEQIGAVSENVVFGVDGKDRVFQYTINKNGNTRRFEWPGSLRQISVGSDDAVWGIDSDGNVYQLMQFGIDGASWEQVSGNLEQISVGTSTNIWGIGSGGSVYRYNNNGGFDQMDGQLTHVSVGGDGVVMGVDAAGNVFVYRHASNEWHAVCGSLTYVEVGSASHVWGIGHDGSIYKASVAVSSGFASARPARTQFLLLPSSGAKSQLPNFIRGKYVPAHSHPALDGDKVVVIGTWKDIQFMIGMVVFGMFVFCACLAAIRWKISRPKVVYGMVNVNSDTEAAMELNE